MVNSTGQHFEVDDSELSDNELIQSALEGDQRGYELLASRYEDRLFHFIRNNVGCSTFAQDIVQEAFLQAFQHLASLRNRSNFYTWLCRIALNSRRKFTRKSVRTVSLDSNAADLVMARPERPSARMERDEERAHVRDALSRLDNDHQTILMLREFEGLDYDQIAKILQIKPGTVRSRLSRARSRMREILSRNGCVIHSIKSIASQP